MQLKQWSVRCLIGTAIAVSVLLSYGIFIEPYQLEIHHVRIQDPALSKLLEKKTIVQLSDLHINTIGAREKNILKILDDLRPDIIFLTGDYVKWKGNYKAALNFLAKLKARIGIWGVMGDYDYSRSRKSCLFCHEEESTNFTRRHSIRFLRDSEELLHLPNGTLRISGIDFKKDYTYEKSLPIKMIGPSIILSHSPLSFNLLDRNQNLFMLAGDTHGGQIPLPSWFSGIIGYEKNASYSQGLFRNGKTKMFVSRGIGTSHIPIRLFRKPEIVVFHFNGY
jgi:uncharacterized protein